MPMRILKPSVKAFTLVIPAYLSRSSLKISTYFNPFWWTFTGNSKHKVKSSESKLMLI